MTRMAFIFSTGRTGTKFLAHYFNHNYHNVLALHEPRPSYPLRIAANACVAGHLPDETLLKLLRWARRSVLKEAQGYECYLEATPFIYGAVRVIDRFTSDPIILHVVRDPREVTRSAHNHASYHGIKHLVSRFIPYWFPPVGKIVDRRSVSTIGLAAAKWQFINQTLADLGPSHGDYHVIRFETLFDENRTGIREICQILGLPYLESPSQVSADEKINPGRLHRLGHWRTWPEEACQELHRICSPLMQEYGYGGEAEWLAKVESRG
jgi:hypothetical protein